MHYHKVSRSFFILNMRHFSLLFFEGLSSHVYILLNFTDLNSLRVGIKKGPIFLKLMSHILLINGQDLSLYTIWTFNWNTFLGYDSFYSNSSNLNSHLLTVIRERDMELSFSEMWFMISNVYANFYSVKDDQKFEILPLF